MDKNKKQDNNQLKANDGKPCACKDKINALQKELEEMKSKYLRAIADYHNLERRISETLAQQQEKRDKELLLKFLEIIDQMQQAQIFVKDEGLKLILNSALTLLSSLGVQPIKLSNTEYDPNFAECTNIVPGDKNDIVVEIVREGYTLNGKLLRPARVTVSKNQ